ncbi:MAG: PLP-dependent aminotransferase family protein [Rhodospirillaceae bacterium]|jgi:DNA-binding transcriptional MocR family regulator|nr:PLP-dependent aminotransferase family protein [Rhodospirillaceae bacterium]MBT3493579.1 PLP-dependent aminotransferase family protein [Rhodospirillaceae bacterium]MBT3780176.1 PLP-dependent aminotransferase family protein [Rhodospirillaceae bacterium]MBT3976918.1 PLP-dependent aminotransferase family protein [Rhodospirillaceae bacterium]MBT4167048.1 PLP-dependent aminotransferase family protein [Rhodospirillaceae bacterium]
MTIYQPDITGRSGAKYRAIAQVIGEDIASGHLAPGTRLPPHRDLAWRLGVTVGTISRAYREAARLHLVGGEVGRGTYVQDPADTGPASLAPSRNHLIEMTQNSPPLGPHGAALADSLRTMAEQGHGNALLGYNTEIGPEAHRRAGAKWLARVGLEVTADDVILMGGAQAALLSTLLSFSRADDPVLLERLTYSQLIDGVHFTQRRPVAVAIDDEGIVPAALDAACTVSGAKLLFLVPTLQNPTNAVMSLERRKAIVEVARQHDLLLVEDDVYGYLVQDRPPPIASLAPERTIYITSASKCLAPGLRVAWVTAPRTRLLRLAEAARVITVTQPGLTGAVASQWIEDGRAEDLLQWQRRETAARYEIAAQQLAGLDWHGHEAAYHVLLNLPAPWRADDFAAAARQDGIAISTLAPFAVEADDAEQAVRVTLSQPPDRATLTAALSSLRNILERGPNRPRAII